MADDAQPTYDLDELDLALVEALRRDGRAGNRSLGAELGVNEVTVANRIRRLSAASVIRVVALTDIEAFGHELPGVRVHPRRAGGRCSTSPPTSRASAS